MASAQISAPVNTTMTELPDPNVIITDRLVLRPLLPTDGDAVYTIRSNPQVAKCFVFMESKTRAEFDACLKQVMESEKCVAHRVELRVSSQREGEKRKATEQNIIQNKENEPSRVDEKQGKNKVIGVMGAHDVPEIGYMFLPGYWGKGYATEALKAWMEWYWKAYPGGNKDRKYLMAVTGPDAVNSQNVLQKCGFTWRRKFQQELERFEGDEYEGKKHIMLDFWRAERPHFV